jgi:hypothetical protein
LVATPNAGMRRASRQEGEPTGSRSAASTASGDAQPSWAAALIGNAANQAAEAVESRLASRIAKLEDGVSALDLRIGTIEKKHEEQREECKAAAVQAALAAVQHLPAGGSSAFVPTSVELRGPCAFSAIDSEGFTREYLTELVPKLVAALPEGLRDSVGEWSLRGLCVRGERGYSCSVEIRNHKHVQEVCGV